MARIEIGDECYDSAALIGVDRQWVERHRQMPGAANPDERIEYYDYVLRFGDRRAVGISGYRMDDAPFRTLETMGKVARDETGGWYFVRPPWRPAP